MNETDVPLNQHFELNNSYLSLNFPLCSDCEIFELDDILGQETLPSTQRTVKGIGQQLLLLQDQVSFYLRYKRKNF